MRIVCEMSLSEFKFWAGAKDSRERFTYEEMDALESMLEDCYEGEMDETALNDLFWFEPEILCEWLGIDFEEWCGRTLVN